MNGMTRSAFARGDTVQTFDWNLVRSFLACLDAGSISAAARDTGISQPTLGRHISELEVSLGVTLFERGRAGLVPTGAALEIAQSAREMQQASNALSMAATGNAENVSGTVRITASDIVATYLLPDIIRDALQEFAEIDIELVASNAIENLLQRDADIAVRMIRPTQNDLITRKVNDFSMGVFARYDYLETHGTPRNMEDLAGHVLIGYDRSDLIIRGFAQFGYTVDRSFFRFRCDNQISAFEAMAAGVGIGFGPVALARRHADLVPILQEFALPSLPMWITAHRELRTSRKIRLVNDFVGDRLAALAL